MDFTKMQGLGNDYIYINCTNQTVQDPERLAVHLSDRHFGVGGDGLVLIMESERQDFRMRMFNADGSEAEMCGNAIRCVGKYVYDRALTKKKELSIETLAGEKKLVLNVDSVLNRVDSVRVDMGEPMLECGAIPVVYNQERFINQVVEDALPYRFTCVSVGNPHAVTFVENVENTDVKSVGSAIENHKIFPQKINVEFAQIIDRKNIKMRVWERGAGETLACGTGACAVLVAAVTNQLCDNDVVVHLLGGYLDVSWDKKSNHIYMTGPAVCVFDGKIN